VWVDTYTTEYSRDIEPTVEGGDLSMRMAKSCIALYKQGLTCSDIHQQEEEKASASDDSYLCCNETLTNIWSNVWSLAQSQSSGYLLTKDNSEKETLLSTRTWEEVCVPVGGPSVFCSDVNIDGRNGPFILFNTFEALQDTNYEGSLKLVSIYRCLNTTSNYHFIVANDDTCKGYSNEGLLGYGTSNRYGEMPRALRTCVDPNTFEWYHALDVDCFEGLVTSPSDPIAYVR
jgi:hypothetical protein